MFQKPLNDLLARASNKHCSLHRISQVDMKDSWLADIIKVAPQRCFLCLIVIIIININIIFWESHQNMKAVWSTGGNSEFLLVIVFLTDRPLRPRWKTPWSSDTLPHEESQGFFFPPWGATWTQTGNVSKHGIHLHHDPSVGQEQVKLTFELIQ